MMSVFLLLLLAAVSHPQPSWRSALPAGAGAQASAPAGGQPSPAKIVYRLKTVRDTVRVADTLVRLDTVVVRDTVRDTVQVLPAQYKYVIRYALTSINVDTKNPEWLDNASHSEIVARDTATLKIGVETIRTLGTMVDQYGNRFPQQDIITTGFTISVRKDMAVIEYRGKNSIAVFSGGFDSSGFLIATGEITETGFLASLFPFSLFAGTGRKRLIIEITREAYL
jgi:hypothetical protein